MNHLVRFIHKGYIAIVIAGLGQLFDEIVIHFGEVLKKKIEVKR